jgi:hypothetical protein
MIIATTKYETCINHLAAFLDKSYPGITFKIIGGPEYTLLIEASEEEMAMWIDANDGLFPHMITFCEGYVIGWESSDG